MIGIVTGFEFGPNRDGTKDVLKLQVQIADPDDIQTVEYMSSAGDDTIPPVGSIVTILSAGPAWKIAIASQDNITPSMSEGERKIYSSSGGAIKAFINWLSSGILELNGNSDFAVRFNALETGFNALRSDHNTFLVHVHGASGTPPVPPAVPSTASISAAKVDEVKII